MVSASRPFCCTTCGRRAWSAAPEDAAPVTAFTAPVDEVHDVSLAAVDAILSDLPPAGCVADLDHLDGDGLGILSRDHQRVRHQRASEAPRGETLEEPPAVERETLFVHGRMHHIVR